MPYGVKGGIIPYLSFIIDPFGVIIHNNLIDKSNYLESYLIILFIHETNHFSERCNFIYKPLSLRSMKSVSPLFHGHQFVSHLSPWHTRQRDERLFILHRCPHRCIVLQRDTADIVFTETF